MKRLILFIACFATFQAVGQQNQNDNDEPQILKAQVSERVVVTQEYCSKEGYKISLSRDKGDGNGVSTRRYLSAEYLGSTFYASSADVADLENSPGVPNPGENPRSSDPLWPGPRVTVANLNSEEASLGGPYCDADGFRITSNPIYRVTVKEPGHEQSSLVTITDGSNLDGADYSFLAITYNNRVSPEMQIPTTCHNGCFMSAGDGGTNDGGGTAPGGFTDASGQTYDYWGEPTGEDGEDIGNGGFGSWGTSVLTSAIDAGGIVIPSGEGDHGSLGGGTIGVVTPLSPGKKISWGIHTSLGYFSSKTKLEKEPIRSIKINNIRMDVQQNPSSIKEQTFMMGTGPEVDFALGEKLVLNTIFQAGWIYQRRDGFKSIQNFYEGDLARPFFSKTLFERKDSKESGFYWMPKIRLLYTIHSAFGIWIEANYLGGSMKENVQQVNMGMPAAKDGSYSLGQIRDAQMISISQKRKFSNSPGFGMGIRVKF